MHWNVSKAEYQLLKTVSLRGKVIYILSSYNRRDKKRALNQKQKTQKLSSKANNQQENSRINSVETI